MSTYVHEGRHRLEDRPTAELEPPTDLEVRLATLLAEMRGWGDVYPNGMHALGSGRPLRGRKSFIRTETLRHAATLRSARLDTARAS